MTKKIKVAVADDQRLFREGLISLLAEFEELEITGQAANGKELLEAVKAKQPDVVLLDYEMPLMDGAETTARLRSGFPGVKVLILTMHSDEEIILHLVEKGAHGFLLKDTNIELVVDAVHAVTETGYYFNNSISRSIIRDLVEKKKIRPDFLKEDTLTEREVKILQMICQEMTSKEIGEKLFITAKTVDTHKYNIQRKTGARNVAGMVMYAVKNNLIG